MTCNSTVNDTYNNQSSMMPPPGTTASLSQSASGFSRLTISSQSPGISSFRSYSSRINSPSTSFSRLNSPSFSKAAMHRFVEYRTIGMCHTV